MKTLDITKPVQYETTVNNHPFVVTGDFESVAPIYERSSVPLGKPTTKARQTRIQATQTVEQALEASKSLIATMKAKIALEKKMMVYDMWHHTNYRTAYHQAMQEARNKAFEESLGLVRK